MFKLITFSSAVLTSVGALRMNQLAAAPQHQVVVQNTIARAKQMTQNIRRVQKQEMAEIRESLILAQEANHADILQRQHKLKLDRDEHTNKVIRDQEHDAFKEEDLRNEAELERKLEEHQTMLESKADVKTAQAKLELAGNQRFFQRQVRKAAALEQQRAQLKAQSENIAQVYHKEVGHGDERNVQNRFIEDKKRALEADLAQLEKKLKAMNEANAEAEAQVESQQRYIKELQDERNQNIAEEMEQVRKACTEHYRNKRALARRNRYRDAVNAQNAKPPSV